MREKPQHKGAKAPTARPNPSGTLPQPLPPLPQPPQPHSGAMLAEDCIIALKALGESHRMRIVRLLLRKQLGVNEISIALRLSQYNTSKHLKILKEAGLLEMQKRGTQRLYTVAPRWKDRVSSQGERLELGCCSFRFDPDPLPDPSQTPSESPPAQ